jgi:NADH-quinone oxidoreductase subunit I
MTQKPTYSELQKTYLPGVLAGIWVTFCHFFANLSRHIVGLLYPPARRRASFTIQYPEQQRPLFPRLRSLHRLTRRADGSPRCVACMMCETICPALCIYIVAEEHPDLNIEKRPKSFIIDLGRCVFCGLCVEACPEDAIRMDTTILEFSTLSREEMVYNLEQLLALEATDRDVIK